MAEYLSISHYIRTDGMRVDVMSQSLAEALSLVMFFDQYPLQSYKAEDYAIWRKYVKSLEDDTDSGKQRQTSGLADGLRDRSDYYNMLALKLSKVQSGTP